MTVTGPVDPLTLGHTQVHEHLYIDARDLLKVHPYGTTSIETVTIDNAAELRWNPGCCVDNYHQTDVDQIGRELCRYRDAGGDCIVDVTPSHLGRAPDVLRDLADRTGLRVVMGGGWYLSGTHPESLAGRSEDDLAQELIDEFRDGVGPGQVRPGIIGELGTGDPLTASEQKVLRAAAAAQRATGLAITVHVHPWGFEGTKVLRTLLDAGASPRRIVLGHMNTAIHDAGYQRELLEAGVYLAYDLFGFDHSLIGLGRYPPSDFDVAAKLDELASDGWLDQLLISQDMGGVKTRLVEFGGWGYAHILEHVLPMLVTSFGWQTTHVERLTRSNPATMLALDVDDQHR